MAVPAPVPAPVPAVEKFGGLTACSGGDVRTSGFGNVAQIATVGTDGVSATDSTGIFSA